MRSASFVIRKFGGVRKLARAVGRSPSSVSRWKRGKATGRIPVSMHKVILKAAKKLGISVN